jgi:nitrite reductase (NADH) large subunit
MASKQRLVVIGNGMAGARFVEEVIARDGRNRFDITVFGDEPYGNYNRILLSSVLAGTHQPADIFINPLAWYGENGVKLHLGVRAGWIDRLGKTVHAPGGIVEPYDVLVLATGSSPFIPPMAGVFQDDGTMKSGVFAFRTLDDCEKIASRAAQSKKAVVIGGGLLGLEAARGLLSRGLEVHVVHLVAYLMEMQLDPQAGAILRQTMEKMGLRVHLEKAATAVLGDGQMTSVGFKDGSTLDCDMLVISTGVRPNVEIAKHCGLAVERAIVVGDDLSTRNDPSIYAIGECAQHRGKTYGLVAPLWDQARVLAERLTGRNPKALYLGSKVSTKLKVMGVDMTVMGEKDPKGEQDEVVHYMEPSRGVYRKLIIRGGRLAGAILLGDGLAAPDVLRAFDRGDVLPENRAELLFPAFSTGKALSVADMPESAQVCNCNGVSKGHIAAAVKQGCRTLKAVMEATRAGTGCGSCKPEVKAVLEYASDGLVAEDPSVHYYVPGVPMVKPELIEAIKGQGLRSVSAVFQALAGGKEDPGSKAGLASLLKTIWGKDYEDERDARFINDRVHANIQKDGTFSVVPRIYGGVTTPEQLRKIADAAEKYSVRLVKITGGQRIDLLGIKKEDLPGVWSEIGMPSGHAYSKAFRTCKTCVGTEFCRYGVGDSVALGIKVERRFQGLEAPHKMKLAVSGCPRNCAEATTKDLGAVALEGGKWEVLIGGAAGSRVRKGDVLCVVESHEDVLKFMGRLMQYYREQARYKERTYDFVERVGVEKLRRLLIEDAEGICGRLDREMQASVDAYRDPWAERAAPAHPAQFASTVAVAER